MLTDKHGRIHDYLRISLTEKCNLRCTYCMPENGIELLPNSSYMTADEVLQIASVFNELGVNKIRLTGGEPLVRKDFSEILSSLSRLSVELSITTNGILLDRYLHEIKESGISTMNVSLDTLDPHRFAKITRRNDFDRVMRNIDLCIQEGLSVKINSVLMKGSNDDEIIPLINWSSMKGIDLRFIEFMPFDGNNWDWSKTVSEKDILDKVYEHYGIHQVIQLEPKPHSTSRNYRLSGASGSFGMISTITNPFCDTCNRIRLTADGKIKNCLFSSKETDLLSAFRSGKDIKQLIIDEISAKHPSRSGLDMSDQQSVQQHQNRAMISIGG